MSGIYGNEFEDNMNVLMNSTNVRTMAKKFVALEKANGPYSFGMFAKMMLPRPADWADDYGSTKGYAGWEKHSGSIPKEFRDRLTVAVGSNLRSDNPLPMLLKVGSNVDGNYEVQIKNFVHEGVEHIGILMLCPNPALLSASKSEQIEKAPVGAA